MNINHKDIVIFFAKVISTLINWAVTAIAIIAVGVILWGFYKFVVEEMDPVKIKSKYKKNKLGGTTTQLIIPYEEFRPKYHQYIIYPS